MTPERYDQIATWFDRHQREGSPPQIWSAYFGELVAVAGCHDDLVEAVSYLLGVLQAEGIDAQHTYHAYRKEVEFAKKALSTALASEPPT